MHPVIAKTFGGLSVPYYFRHFAFGLVFSVLIGYTALSGPRSVSIGMMLMVLVNTLLYPYSRFVYEGVVGFVMGRNVFVVNAFLMLLVKAATMALCWMLAIFIAPLGLAYLYVRHSRAARLQ